MTRGRARGAASAALGRLKATEQSAPADAAEPAPSSEVAELRQQLQRSKRRLAKLEKRLTSLEEEVAETRRIGHQVAHLGDLVSELLARSVAGSDAFPKDLSSYSDDL